MEKTKLLEEWDEMHEDNSYMSQIKIYWGLKNGKFQIQLQIIGAFGIL